MKKPAKHEHTESLPPDLADLVDNERDGYGQETSVPILDPFPTVERAREFRKREGPPESGGHYIARDVEIVRNYNGADAARSAAVGRVAAWLDRKWKVPDMLRPTIAEMAHHLKTPESESGRRVPGGRREKRKKMRPIGDTSHTYLTVKRQILAHALYLTIVEDDQPIPVSHRKLGVKAGHSFVPLRTIYGNLTKQEAEAFFPLIDRLWVPGAFGWWSLYRDWLIARTRFHAERRLEAMNRDDILAAEVREAEKHFALDREEDPTVIADNDYENRLTRLIAALPDDRTRQIILSLEPHWHHFMASALGVGPRGRQILIPKQRRVMIALAQHGGDRARAYQSVGMNRSAGDKVLKRAFDRLRALGLHAFVE